jgi:hypothetical protein
MFAIALGRWTVTGVIASLLAARTDARDTTVEEKIERLANAIAVIVATKATNSMILRKPGKVCEA